MTLIIKAAESELDWPVRYDLEIGETIASSTWSVSPVETGGISVKAGSPSIASPLAACILTGGLFRHVYEVRNVVVTSAGRSHSQTLGFRVGPVEPS